MEEARWLSLVNKWPEYCCVQQRHSYIRKKHGTSFQPQVAANEELFDYLKKRGITLLAYSALLSGAYTRHDRQFDKKYQGQDTDNRLAAIKAVATELGISANQVILAWMLQGDPPVLPLIAASTSDQMRENIDSLGVTLASEQMQRLDNAGP